MTTHSNRGCASLLAGFIVLPGLMGAAPAHADQYDFVVYVDNNGVYYSYEAIETLIKGPELSLTDHGQLSYLDKDGHVRAQARLRWWSTGSTLNELAEMASTFTMPDGSPYPELPALSIANDDHVYRGDVPVVYGQYWRTGTPVHGLDWTDRTACVDFSAVKGGTLTAYRWSGESTVRLENYLQIGAGRA